MGFNLADILPQIEQTAKNAKTIKTGMEELIDICEEHHKHKGWSKLRGLDFESDSEHLIRFFTDLLKDKPPSANIDGLYFGLFHPDEEEGKVSCDLSVFGVPGLMDSNGDWDDDEVYSVEEAEARSQILAEIYVKAQQRGGVGHEAVAGLAIGYATMVVLEICSEEPETLLSGGAKQRAIVVGFEEGDCLLLGSVDDSGFVPIRKSQRRKRSSGEASGFTLVTSLTTVSGRRILDEMAIEDYEGNHVSPSAFMENKMLNVPLPLQMGIVRNGPPADFEFIGGYVVPVVSAKVAKVLKEMADDTIQLLPVQIAGSIGEHYIVNALLSVETSIKQPKDGPPHLDDSLFPQSHAFAVLVRMSEFGGYSTFRIALSAALREQLNSLDVTGVLFEEVPDGSSGFVLN